MEKICEFCTAFRPVVYCKSDAAHLCLSCDAKVHSANALSNRHLRIFLCDACKYRPSYIQCLDHQMLMCRGCDHRLHDFSSQHKKRAVSSYMGCPSAKDFAAMWGFDLNKLHVNAIQDHSLSSSLGYVNQNPINLDIPKQSCSQIGASSVTSVVNCANSVSGVEFDVGSSSQQSKIYYEGQHQPDNCFILQQILELKKLQRQEQTEIRSSMELDENLDQGSQQSRDLGSDLQQTDNPNQELKVNLLPSPFSLLEHLPSSSTAGVTLHGESFWQCKSPIHCSQLWSQNMQDLGVCEDIVCHDDFNIPDVDLTFRNFEELFGADQEPLRALLDDKPQSCSSFKKDMSFDKSDNGNARAMEDVSVASACIAQSAQIEIDTGPSIQIHDFPRSMESPCPIQPSYSTMSSISRFNDCLDSRLLSITGGEISCDSPDQDGVHFEPRENAMTRYKEKKKARLHEKQIQYAALKARADVRKQRVKGRLVKTEGYDSDTVNATRSY